SLVGYVANHQWPQHACLDGFVLPSLVLNQRSCGRQIAEFYCLATVATSTVNRQPSGYSSYIYCLATVATGF
ncbi:MAG: hypothetical protein ABI557_09735, partial [Aureliella sp.]